MYPQHIATFSGRNKGSNKFSKPAPKSNENPTEKKTNIKRKINIFKDKIYNPFQ